MIKGLIALDIDGTITADHHLLPMNVAEYFTQLASDGWLLMFITGRTFSWGHEVLKGLPFPYYFAVQNGAIILQMPERHILSIQSLERSIIPAMNAICLGKACDYVIYAGIEHGDLCYYRPKMFSAALLDYVQQRARALKEDWREVDSYGLMPIDSFASIKCFGLYPDALQLAEEIERTLGLHAPLIRDPFDSRFYVVQATHPEINKGQALKNLLSSLNLKVPVIAAGDDLNDVSMLNAANIRVVMATAPPEMLSLADIVAPSALDEGIIEGLQRAIKDCEEKC